MFARGMFSRRNGDFERLLPIFDNVNVENRHFCVPVEWFEQDHTFPEKNALYVEHALDLSEKAARRALDRVGAGPEEVGAIFFVSTTGLSTPSLDSKLIFRLGLSSTRAESRSGAWAALPGQRASPAPPNTPASIQTSSSSSSRSSSPASPSSGATARRAT